MQRRAIFASIVCCFALYTALPGQQTTAPPIVQPPSNPRANDSNTLGTGPFTPEQQHEIEKRQREQRQKQLHDDTDKLFKLATELKDSVDKSNENVLSLDVVRKAEEIEKLAKHIKTNMRDESR